MKASVIIPTFNGAQKLPGILAALRSQTTSDFEIIVIVDGSTDDSLAVLTGWEKQFPSFRVIKQQNEGRAGARNRGVEYTTGDLLIFYDDDMIPFPDSVERHIHFHKSYVESICTGSQKEKYDVGKSRINNYKAYLSEAWLAAYPAAITKLTMANLFFTAANCSIRRSQFDKLNGFDNNLRDAEDLDLAIRALKAGMAVYIDKQNQAWHEENYTLNSLIKRQDEYRKAHKVLETKHSILISTNKPFFKNLIQTLLRSKFVLGYLNSKYSQIIPTKLYYRLLNLSIF